MTFDDPEKLRELIPPNLRDTELFTLLQDMITTARAATAEQLDDLENLTNPDRDGDIPGEGYHENIVVAMVADSLVKLGYDHNSLGEILTVAKILYTWKGTVRALQTALDLFDVPFIVVDANEVNDDPVAYNMVRDLSCEILLMQKPDPAPAPTEEDYAKAAKAMEFFMWICVDPIFLLTLVFDNTINVVDDLTLQYFQTLSTRIIDPKPENACINYPAVTRLRIGDDGFYIGGESGATPTSVLVNLGGKVFFPLFSGGVGEGESVRILSGTPPALSGDILDLENHEKYTVFLEVYGDADKILFSKGDDTNPGFIVYISESRVSAEVWGSSGSVTYTATDPLFADQWNTISFVHGLTFLSLYGSSWSGTEYLDNAAAAVGKSLKLGNSDITNALTNGASMDLRRLMIVAGNDVVYNTGLLAHGAVTEETVIVGESIELLDYETLSNYFTTSDGQECLGILDNLESGNEVLVYPTNIVGGYLEQDTQDGDDYYPVSGTPDDAADSELELDSNGDLMPKATASGSDVLLEEEVGGDLTFTTYSVPAYSEDNETMLCDSIQGGDADFQDNYPVVVPNAWEEEEYGWLQPVLAATTVSDPLFEEETPGGDLRLKEANCDACDAIRDYVQSGPPVPVLSLTFDAAHLYSDMGGAWSGEYTFILCGSPTYPVEAGEWEVNLYQTNPPETTTIGEVRDAMQVNVNSDGDVSGTVGGSGSEWAIALTDYPTAPVYLIVMEYDGSFDLIESLQFQA